ncbi:SdrD B-like domain-containing protein [Actinomyces sp. HMSC065F12]|uniref:SdrD B-like domain-containing protein n=1 Tax=Actinomyces sp. HMSC065F12 TaxID=1739479 RepID=UPI0008B0535C|nr:SdrD B-like domain-containing protein [Actinomyces sp. HMSC065F12]OFP72181.1 hypothetical protein HMPREF2975_08675 [Actinomyces sp. HMSC065F12]
MRKTGFGKILAALLATSMVGTMLASVTPTAQAAQQSYAFSTIQKIYDGTGHGTPAQTFIQTKNGFSPADDTPTDGVVATNDFVQYEVTTQFAAGPEREVVVDFQAPEFLTFSQKDNSSLCASNQFVSSRYTGSSTHGQCTYSLKRGVPITVKVPLTMRGGDTAGVAVSGQSMGVKTGDELAEAPSVTVVSAPSADMVVSTDTCNRAMCTSKEASQTRGSVILTPEELRRAGSTKGSTASTPWSGTLDTGGMPEATWTLDGKTLEVRDGKVIVPTHKGEARLEYSVKSWGDLADGESKVFTPHFQLDKNAFATDIYRNNGDGWQPGDGLGVKDSTANLRGTNSIQGFGVGNNDYVRLAVYKPLPPPPGRIFGKELYRPFDMGETLWDPGNKVMNNHPTLVRNHATSLVAEGTEFNTVLKVYPTQGTHTYTVTDQWDPRHVSSRGESTIYWGGRTPSGVKVEWSLSATGRQVTSGSGEWVESMEAPKGARAVRVTFTNVSGGSANPLSFTMPQVVNTFTEPIPAAIPDTATGLVDGKTDNRVNQRELVPALPSPMGIDLHVGSNRVSKVDPVDRTVTYTVESVIKNQATVKQLFGPSVMRLATDPCLLNIRDIQEPWTVVEKTDGTGCGTPNAKPGSLVLSIDDPIQVKSFYQYNGESMGSLPKVRLTGDVSLIAADSVSLSATVTTNGHLPNGKTHPLTARGEHSLIVDRIATVSEYLQQKVKEVEIGDLLSWDVTISGAHETGAYKTDTVVVLPGKGNDSQFMETLRQSGSTGYDGPVKSNFHGTYVLKKASIDRGNSDASSTLMCTNTPNPSLDPTDSRTRWSTTCDADTTAVRIHQDGGNGKVGVTRVNIDLEPEGNKTGDEYLMWVGPVHATGIGNNKVMAWPADIKVVSSSVSGHVFWNNKEDGSGVYSAGEPISGVTVELLDKDGAAVGKTTTDSDGFYEFSELRSGMYVTKISDYPTDRESDAQKGVKNPSSIVSSPPRVRGIFASNRSMNLNVAKNSRVDSMDFSLFAADPYADVRKNPAEAVCSGRQTECAVEWNVTVKNGGNVPLVNGVFSDATSSNVAGITASTGVKVVESLDSNGAYYRRSDGVILYRPHGLEGEVTAVTTVDGVPIHSMGVVVDPYSGWSGQMIKNSEIYVVSGGIPYLVKDGVARVAKVHQLYAGTDAQAVRLVKSNIDKEVPVVIYDNGDIRPVNADSKSWKMRGQDYWDANWGRTRVSLDNGVAYLISKSNPKLRAIVKEDGGLARPQDIIGEGPEGPVMSIRNGLIVTAGGRAFAPDDSLSMEIRNSPPLGYSMYCDKTNVWKAMEPKTYIGTDGRLYTRRSSSSASGCDFDVVKIWSDTLGKTAGPLDNVVDFDPYNSAIITGDGKAYTLDGRGARESFVEKQEGVSSTLVGFEKKDDKLYARASDGTLYQYQMKGWYTRFPDWAPVPPEGERTVSVSQGTDTVAEYYYYVTDKGNVYEFTSSGIYRQVDGFVNSVQSITPSSTVNDGKNTTRTYNVPLLKPGESITYTVRGTVNRKDAGQVVTNQAFYTQARTPRDTPTAASTPAFDAKNPTGFGKLTGNRSCTATSDWETPGDACDQVYAQVPKAEVPVGSITGNVFWDQNRDGRYTNGEGRVAGSTVTLMQGDTPVSTQVTDPNGRYTFDGLPMGTYRVVFNAGDNPDPEKSWAFTTRAQSCSANVSCADTASGASYDITLTSSARTKTDVNAGLVTYDAAISVHKGVALNDTETDLAKLSQDSVVEDTDKPFQTIVVTNTGEEPVGSLSFSDVLEKGPAADYAGATTAQCAIGNLKTADQTATFTDASKTVLKPGGTLTCRIPLALSHKEGQDEHRDTVTVTGTSTITKTPVSDSSSMRVRLRELPAPMLTVQKGRLVDGVFETNIPANDGQDVAVTVRITNSGGEDLKSVDWSDHTIVGRDQVRDFTCQWPGVEGELKKGEHVDCVGTLTVTAPSKHVDQVFAVGVGVTSGKLAQDDAEFSAYANVVFPASGAPGYVALIMLGVLIGAASLLVVRRRS